MLLTSQPTATPDTPIPNADGIKGPAALGLGNNSVATSSLALKQVSRPRPFSGKLQSAAVDKDGDVEIKIKSIHSTITGARPGVSQTTQGQETVQIPAGPATSLYAIFSPGQLRHGVQPLAHTGSQGAASPEAATAGQSPDGVAKSDAETPEAQPGPQSHGVPCSRAAAAGMEPEWLHNDLDEMLPDGMTGPAWSAQPPRVSKAPARNAAATGSTAVGAKDAAGPAMALIKPTYASTSPGRSAVVEDLGSMAASTESTSTLALAGARPLSAMKATVSSAAAAECPSSPVGTVHAGGSTMAAALATAPSVNSQGANCDGFAAIASMEAPAIEKNQSFAPLTSILAAQDSAGNDTAVAMVKGGTLKAEISNHQTKWGTDVAWQHNSNDREDMYSILERRLQLADARCAELEAELAAKEAAVQLACSENAELAARCERLDRHLAEAEAAAQLMGSERSSLKERCMVRQKKAESHAAAMDAVRDECDEARSRCDTLEEILAEREACMEKAVADLMETRARCEEPQQKVQEDREAKLAAKEQLWAAERPRILGAIRRLRSERQRLNAAASNRAHFGAWDSAIL
ncbi:hypothetical protein COCOBI_07-6630 [Coccomyxa sp. Obi]|nr:hypothetical protein COCOBI_07-6630 [Coccomyxa sp. Obi]